MGLVTGLMRDNLERREEILLLLSTHCVVCVYYVCKRVETDNENYYYRRKFMYFIFIELIEHKCIYTYFISVSNTVALIRKCTSSSE